MIKNHKDIGLHMLYVGASMAFVVRMIYILVTKS